MTEILKGKKTYLGAIFVFMAAIGTAGSQWYNGQPINFEALATGIGIGLGILGIGFRLHNQ